MNGQSVAFFFSFYIYFEREREQEGGRSEGVGEREFQADSMPRVEPDAGLNSRTLRS